MCARLRRGHLHFLNEILRRMPSLEEMSELARIVLLADIFDVLAAKRPDRDAWPLDTVLPIMAKDAPSAIDADCFTAPCLCSCDAL